MGHKKILRMRGQQVTYMHAVPILKFHPPIHRCQRVLQSYDQIIPNGQSLANLVDGDRRTDHAAFFQTPLENCRTLLPKTRFAWQHGDMERNEISKNQLGNLCHPVTYKISLSRESIFFYHHFR